MQPALQTSLNLFPQLLGESWGELAADVREFHDFEQTVEATGTFYVRHGRWPARWIAWLLGLPAASEAVKLQLQVISHEGQERWQRSFAGRPMLSLQYRRPDGLLIERVGNSEVYFRVVVTDGGLHFQTVGTSLCLGRWRLPLPRWLGPTITARETPLPGTGLIEVFVEMRLPVLGTLITYGGLLNREKSRP